MFDRYRLKVILNKLYIDEEIFSDMIVDTYFTNIDSLVKFINRFNSDSVVFLIEDLLFPDRNISSKELLSAWRSK